MERRIRLDIEELEERIAPGFLGGGNSPVEMHGAELHCHLPNGETVDFPAEAKDGLATAVAGGG